MLGICRGDGSGSESESVGSGSAGRCSRCRALRHCLKGRGSDSASESELSASELERLPPKLARKPSPRARASPAADLGGLPLPVSKSSMELAGIRTLRVQGEPSQPPATTPAAVPPAAAPAAAWSVERTECVGPEGCEARFAGVLLLDRAKYGSVTEAVEALNGGAAGEADFCVVFSRSQQHYFLLWRQGMERQALSSLRSEDSDEQSEAEERSEEQSELEEALDVPDGVANGCNCEYDVSEAVARGALRQDDGIFSLYKAPSTGLWGLLGLASKQRTIYCHHFTSKTKGGMFAVRAAKEAERHFRSEEDVWAFLGKSPCCGHFRPNGGSEESFVCRPVSAGKHDNTCSPETCLFLAHYLPCPVPSRVYR